MKVRLAQIDGKLPNLALMRLSAFYKQRGAAVTFTRTTSRDLLDGDADMVFGSSVFTTSMAKTERLLREYPNAVLGGTGTLSPMTVEDFAGDYDALDYSLYPSFKNSIGFTQRGCRLKCKFCVVPQKEGTNRSVKAVAQIWRGHPHPKNIHLLDNDFFGQEEWRERAQEIITGGYKVCFNQGINIRLFDKEQAQYLSQMQYRDDQFRQRRIYTAWDNLGDEQRFFDGINTLEAAGVPAKHVMAYMLVGYRKGETFEEVKYRFDRMVERGIKPFPMVYGNCRALKQFQRWAVTGLYRAVPWEEYVPNARAKHRQPELAL